MSFHCSSTWITCVHVPLHIVVLFLIVVAYKNKGKEENVFFIKWTKPVKEKSRQSGETIYKFNKSLLFNFTFLRLWSDLFLWKQCSSMRSILGTVDIFVKEACLVTLPPFPVVLLLMQCCYSLQGKWTLRWWHCYIIYTKTRRKTKLLLVCRTDGENKKKNTFCSVSTWRSFSPPTSLILMIFSVIFHTEHGVS